MKISITISEMSQIQWSLGEGHNKQRSFIVDIPNDTLPRGLHEFLMERDRNADFRKFSNIDLITIVEE